MLRSEASLVVDGFRVRAARPRNDRRMKKLLSSLLPGAAADARARRRQAHQSRRCRAAARTAPSPGACSTICSSDERLDDRRHFRRLGRRDQRRRCSPTAWRAAGARRRSKRLADFWRAASRDGNLPALQRAVIDRLFSFMPLEGSPIQAWFDAMSRYFSPYDVNPLNINPLKDVIERFVDFEALRGLLRSAAVRFRDQCADRARCASSRARRSPPTR